MVPSHLQVAAKEGDLRSQNPTIRKTIVGPDFQFQQRLGGVEGEKREQKQK